jgi:hypothetical protein
MTELCFHHGRDFLDHPDPDAFGSIQQQRLWVAQHPCPVRPERPPSHLVRLSARLMPPVGASSNKNRGFPGNRHHDFHCLLVTRQRRCAVLRGGQPKPIQHRDHLIVPGSAGSR